MLVNEGLVSSFREMRGRSGMTNHLPWGTRFRSRLRRVWHYWRGPTARQVADAQNALRGREYYHLYDDRYRDATFIGGQHGALIADDDIRRRMYLEFDRLRRSGFIPEPSARLIDLGCGQGDVALRFGQLGYQCSGVDVSPVAIQRAMSLAAEQAQHVDFFVGDVLDLSGIPDGSFDIATDIGCLHMLVRDGQRRRYLSSVRRVLRPGGVLFLYNWSTLRDVRIRNENAAILRGITLVERRWIPEQNAFLTIRGTGFRGASMRQYCAELRGSGFEIVCHDRRRNRPFGMILARVP